MNKKSEYPIANHNLEEDMKLFFEKIKKIRSSFFSILCD